MGCSWCQDGWGPPGCPDHDADYDEKKVLKAHIAALDKRIWNKRETLAELEKERQSLARRYMTIQDE